MQLGSFVLPHSTLLAPMAGVSDAPYRLIVLELGAGLAPTELISSEGLSRRQERSLRYLRHDPRERPFYVQLFGGDPGRMADAARVAQEHGADLLDVNMGCPVPKVTRGGAGASLMCDPERAAAIVSRVRDATGLPVTVKIRSGWDSASLNAPAFAQRMEQAGACAVAVHARTRAQGYSGHADWSMIAAVKRAVTIPVIGNGDVHHRADAERMVAETGCDAVMVGRAALGNPWLFRELLGGPPPTVEERLQMVLRHFDAHLANVGDPLNGVRSFRRPLLWYAHGLKGAAHFRVTATRLDEPAEVRAAAQRFFSTAETDAGAAAPAPDWE